MATKNVLKEFLVAIGFKVDDQQFKKFELYWEKTGKHFLELGKFATAGAAEVFAGVTLISDQLTKLYYISQRAGTGVGSLQAFQFGARQVGVTADQAAAALEGMAQAMRLSPGTKGLLAAFGINPNQRDTVKTLLQLLNVTRRMPYYQGARYAEMFGIDEQTYFQLTKNYDTLKRQYDVRQKMASSFGLNADDLGATSRQFTNDLITLEARFEILGMVLAKDLLPVMDRAVRWFDKVMNVLGPLDQKTHGISTGLVALVVAIWSTTRALSVMRWVLRLLGLGGRGVGAAGRALGIGGGEAAAGTEGAIAVGGGASVAVVGVIAAVGAALVWMQLHPDKVRSAVKGSWEWVKNEATNAVATAKEAVRTLGFVKTAKIALGAISPTLGNAVGDGQTALGNMEPRFEGFRNKLYKDIAGKWTIGVGHLVRAGEDFSRGLSDQQVRSLEASDLAAAAAAVKRLVKVHLNANQMNALTDFVFSSGAGNLAKSTLLKDVNKGDLAGAAKEFLRWDKAKVNGTYRSLADLDRRRQFESSMFSGQPVTLSQKTTIHVSGVSDPRQAAREAARQQDQVNGRLIRNLSGVVDVPGATIAPQGATP